MCATETCYSPQPGKETCIYLYPLLLHKTICIYYGFQLTQLTRPLKEKQNRNRDIHSTLHTNVLIRSRLSHHLQFSWHQDQVWEKETKFNLILTIFCMFILIFVSILCFYVLSIINFSAKKKSKLRHSLFHYTVRLLLSSSCKMVVRRNLLSQFIFTDWFLKIFGLLIWWKIWQSYFLKFEEIVPEHNLHLLLYSIKYIDAYGLNRRILSEQQLQNKLPTLLRILSHLEIIYSQQINY